VPLVLRTYDYTLAMFGTLAVTAPVNTARSTQPDPAHAGAPARSWGRVQSASGVGLRDFSVFVGLRQRRRRRDLPEHLD
jgi:hypothetical protein